MNNLKDLKDLKDFNKNHNKQYEKNLILEPCARNAYGMY